MAAIRRRAQSLTVVDAPLEFTLNMTRPRVVISQFIEVTVCEAVGTHFKRTGSVANEDAGCTPQVLVPVERGDNNDRYEKGGEAPGLGLGLGEFVSNSKVSKSVNAGGLSAKFVRLLSAQPDAKGRPLLSPE